MAYLPWEIKIEILMRVPTWKSLMKFKSVCKDWYKLINSSYFIQCRDQKLLETGSLRSLVFNSGRYLFCVDDIDFPSKLTKLHWPVGVLWNDDTFIVGSCNGLVCLSLSPSLRCFAICNPTTHTIKEISPPPAMMGWHSCGFGYDSMNEDYKIVIITKRVDKGILVYSCKAMTWMKSSERLPHHYNDGWGSYHRVSGLYINNMLHWMVEFHDGSFRIARFDLSTERWVKEFKLPGGVATLSMVSLGLVDGHIYLESMLAYGPKSQKIWTMKDYGVEKSWTELFGFFGRSNMATYYAPIAYSRRGRKVLYNWSMSKASWYDLQLKTNKAFELNTSPYNSRGLKLCDASLVSIPGSSHMKGSVICRKEISAAVKEPCSSTEIAVGLVAMPWDPLKLFHH